MKKILAILLSVFSVAFASNAVETSIDKRFHEERSFKNAAKQTRVFSGRLVFKAPSYLSMDYDNGEKFLIDGNSVSMLRDGRKQKFDISKNIMMRNLAHGLLYSFMAKNEELAQEQNADMTATEEGGNRIVTISARRKQVQGCSRIIASYNGEGNLLGIVIEEFNGDRTSYVWEKRP